MGLYNIDLLKIYSRLILAHHYCALWPAGGRFSGWLVRTGSVMIEWSLQLTPGLQPSRTGSKVKYLIVRTNLYLKKKKILEDINSFCRMTDNPVLYFWRYLLHVLKPEAFVCVVCYLHAVDSSDLVLVQHLLVSWWPEWQSRLFNPHTCVCITSIGRTQTQDQSCLHPFKVEIYLRTNGWLKWYFDFIKVKCVTHLISVPAVVIPEPGTFTLLKKISDHLCVISKCTRSVSLSVENITRILENTSQFTWLFFAPQNPRDASKLLMISQEVLQVQAFHSHTLLTGTVSGLSRVSVPDTIIRKSLQSCQT